MSEKEATARIKINKLLEAADWRFFPAGDAPANIRLESGVTIKSTDLDALGDDFEKTGKGFVDFLLVDARGFPFIVLEAKAENKNPLVGKEQARKYARSQNCRFVILSNGNLHYFWDLERGNPYVITSFPTLDSVTSYQKVTPNPQRLISEQIGDDYREGTGTNHSFPLVSLGDESLFRVESGGTPKSGIEEYWGGGIPWATLVDLPASNFITHISSTKRTISDKGLRESSAKMIPANSVIVSTRATIGRIAINRIPLATNQGFKNIVIKDAERAVPEYVALALTKLVPKMQAWATGGTFAEISKSKFCELQIPLPPPALQKDFVAEIESYQQEIARLNQASEAEEKKIHATLARIWGQNEPNQAEA